MISYVIPFYKRFALFEAAYRFNSFLCDGYSEILLVLDDPSDEQAAFRFCQKHTELRVKLIVNDTAHEWRPPCKAINVGIRNARGSHIAIFSPENVVLIPEPQFLNSTIAYYGRRLVCGTSYNFGFHKLAPSTNREDLEAFLQENERVNTCAGFILFPRDSAVDICGWDESRLSYGACDGDFQTRLLASSNMRRKWLPYIHVIVVDHPAPRTLGPFEPIKTEAVLVEQAVSWGRDFSRVAYDNTQTPESIG